MAQITNRTSALSRRLLLQSAAAVALSSGLSGPTRAQAKRYRRPNIGSSAGKKSLASYRKAIAAMLALPPSDARNWYRLAIAHALDCPHGNWWFLPWHRGFLGWFEQICRELSGDAEFALPFWDWTAEPRIPADMFEGVLTPSDSAYFDRFSDFKEQFAQAVASLDCWKVVTKSDGTFDYASPYAQLLTRGFRTPADLWFDMFEDPRGKLFFDLAHARGPTRLQPDLDDNAKKAVSLPTLLDALAPKDFLSFASPKALQHGTMAGFGILEGQPHNNVHRCIGGISSPPYGGGFMQANLSPVDPIFWLHHANIDRIWDVWERKQKGQNLPSLPDGAPAEPGDKPLPGSDYAQWAGEPFLFFTDAHGAPARKTTCGDYAEIGEFNYDYEPGSGDEVVSMAAAPASPAGVRTFLAEILTSAVNMARPARATVSMPHALLGETSSPSRFFARITVAFKGPMHAVPLRLSVGRDVGPSANAPGFAGMLTMFGHHTMQGPVTFLVPLSAPMRTMQAGRASRAEGLLPLTIAMGDAAGHIEGHSDSEAGAEILAVAVEMH